MEFLQWATMSNMCVLNVEPRDDVYEIVLHGLAADSAAQDVPRTVDFPQ